MSDVILDDKPPTSFWVFSGAALVWNLIGLFFYIQQVTISPEALATLSQQQQDLISQTPTWATAAFALAVNTGVLASLFLLLRKSWAVPFFAVSLLSVIVQDVDAFVLRGAFGIVGVNGVIIPGMVLIVAILVLFYSRSAKRKRWIT